MKCLFIRTVRHEVLMGMGVRRILQLRSWNFYTHMSIVRNGPDATTLNYINKTYLTDYTFVVFYYYE